MLTGWRGGPSRTFSSATRAAIGRAATLGSGQGAHTARTAHLRSEPEPPAKRYAHLPRCYLRRCDVSNRRLADVADRGLGRLSWADSGCWPNGGNGPHSGHSPHRPEAWLRQFQPSDRAGRFRPGTRRPISNVVEFSVTKPDLVSETHRRRQITDLLLSEIGLGFRDFGGFAVCMTLEEQTSCW